MKKTTTKRKEDVKRAWHLVDAEGKILGRMASKIVPLLMGKNKVDYTPHIDMGDNVVVINAQKVKVTGKKEKQKIYYKHSGYPQGFKEIKFEKLREENPAKIVNWAVKRMLPDNRLRKPRLTRLFIYKGEDHPHSDKFKDGSKEK